MHKQAVILHPGYPKSASTYLQDAVFPLLDCNYLHLNRQQLQALIKPKQFTPTSFTNQITAAIPEYNSEKPLLLSNEGLCWYGQKTDPFADPFRTAERLAASYPNARILFILRNQFSALRSWYTFRVSVEGFESREITPFFEEQQTKGLIEKLCYDKLIRHYQTLFGRENLLLLPLEQLKEDQTSFLKTLFSFFNITAPQTTLSIKKANVSSTLQPVIQWNRRLNRPAGWLRDQLHSAKWTQIEALFRSSYYAILRRYILPLLNYTFANSDKITIPDEIKEQLTPIFAASNGRLSTLTELDLARYHYPLPQKES